MANLMEIVGGVAAVGTAYTAIRPLTRDVSKAVRNFNRHVRSKRTPRRTSRFQRKRTQRKRGPITKRGTSMPAFRRRRRGARRRRVSLSRRRKGRRKTTRFRRTRRRRASRLPRLRLFPGGRPATKKVKLRIVMQQQINSIGGDWGLIEFEPASMFRPFLHMNGPSVVPFPDAGANHKRLIWEDKDGAIAAASNLQPQGYDEWIQKNPGTAGSNNYNKYKVLGSQTTITFINDQVSATGINLRCYAGFSSLFDEADETTPYQAGEGQGFYEKYAHVGFDEVADWLNVAIVKRPQVVQSNAIGSSLKSRRSFIFNYSARTYEKHLKRVGSWTNASSFYGTHDAAPLVSPRVYFMIGDMGASSGLGHPFNILTTVTYTIQLTGLAIPQISTELS